MLETTKSEVWNKMRGKILRLYDDKGFAFIKGDDKKEYFMHYSATTKVEWQEFVACMRRGEEIVVEFTPGQSEKGPRAEDVTRYA